MPNRTYKFSKKYPTIPLWKYKRRRACAFEHTGNENYIHFGIWQSRRGFPRPPWGRIETGAMKSIGSETLAKLAVALDVSAAALWA